ncbi:hypothetical protein [Psittacicella hinzii]|uniref:Uncharacterized protein n=1 Tax=Psittacicella hinzii TaxID=2028575 RepID=A0A3A1YGX4_9GAMM|nr:hypothetical protein [Psittacicella hinzii]RIY35287.1 hypothetical protein CKF58_06835 [Psittacicella hinzii]
MIVAWIAGILRTGKNNPTLLLLIVFMTFFMITQYQSRQKDERIINLAEQNSAYIQRLEAEQLAAKEMRSKIYEMQQEIHKLTVDKSAITRDYHNKLSLVSNELKTATCAAIPLSSNLIKWLQLNPETNKTTSSNSK